MSVDTPKHDELLEALAELPADKVERFAIALGVPRNVVKESRMNNPHDIVLVKSDSLSWWIANKEPSWEAVARALETKTVDERNLAKQIRGVFSGKHGESGPIIISLPTCFQ